MKRFLLTFALALLIAAPLTAADKARQKPKKQQDAPAVKAVMKQLEGLKLSDEQSKNLKDLAAEYGPKLKGAHKKAADLLTADQKQARKDAVAKAKAAGTKRKDSAADIKAAVKLTADQQAALDKAKKETQETTVAFRKAVSNVLTDDQRAQTKLGEKKKGKKAKTT